MRILLFTLISSCLLAASAAADSPQATPTSAPAASRPAATPAAAPAVQGYKLGPGDEVRITEYNTPDLKTEQRISADGEISMPLVGDIHATGLTSEQLARQVETRLKDGFVRDPQISVTVLTYRPFYVTGEVSKPGPYPYQANLDLSSAISAAGGFTSDADRSAVYVRRMGQTTEQKVSMRDAIGLQPGDTVRVNRSLLGGLRALPLGLLGLLP